MPKTLDFYFQDLTPKPSSALSIFAIMMYFLWQRWKLKKSNSYN